MSGFQGFSDLNFPKPPYSQRKGKRYKVVVVGLSSRFYGGFQWGLFVGSSLKKDTIYWGLFSGLPTHGNLLMGIA